MKQLHRPLRRFLSAAVVSLLAAGPLRADDAPQVFLDKPPRIVAYQLKRLSNGQLVALERRPDQAKYKPVYEAILTRKGLTKDYREEAVKGLVKLNQSDPVTELIKAVGEVDAAEKGTLRELVGLLLTQAPDALAARRAEIEGLAAASDNPAVRQAAYAALSVADGKPDAVWALAKEKDDGPRVLLSGLQLIPDPKLREAFYPLVLPLVSEAPDDATRAAAVEAVGALPGHEADSFKLLAGLVTDGPGELRNAAVRSLRRIPAAKWPEDRIEPLARTVVKLVEQTPGDQRTGPATVQQVQLGDDLIAALPPARGAPIRKALRGLSVRVVVVRTLREQMQYDLRYFVVQAGKPVQIVLENDDAMPHNIVITRPGALQEIGAAAGAMPPPVDEKEKTYIPNSPKVLQGTGLVSPDESATLTFTAPAEAGDYDFLCSFPSHWLKMYGVMLVVDDLDQYEQAPKPPEDPLTHKPFDGQKNEPVAGGNAVHQH